MGSVMVLLDIWLKTRKKKYFSTQPGIQLRNPSPYDVSDVKSRRALSDLDGFGEERPSRANSGTEQPQPPACWEDQLWSTGLSTCHVSWQ